MAWLDEPTERLPTQEELALLKIEQGKQLLREAARFSENSARLRTLSIENAFALKLHTDQNGLISNVEPDQ